MYWTMAVSLHNLSILANWLLSLSWEDLLRSTSPWFLQVNFLGVHPPFILKPSSIGKMKEPWGQNVQFFQTNCEFLTPVFVHSTKKKTWLFNFWRSSAVSLVQKRFFQAFQKNLCPRSWRTSFHQPLTQNLMRYWSLGTKVSPPKNVWKAQLTRNGMFNKNPRIGDLKVFLRFVTFCWSTRCLTMMMGPSCYPSTGLLWTSPQAVCSSLGQRLALSFVYFYIEIPLTNIYQPIFLSTYLSGRLFFCLPVCLPICSYLSTYLLYLLHLPLHIFAHLFVYPSSTFLCLHFFLSFTCIQSIMLVPFISYLLIIPIISAYSVVLSHLSESILSINHTNHTQIYPSILLSFYSFYLSLSIYIYPSIHPSIHHHLSILLSIHSPTMEEPSMQLTAVGAVSKMVAFRTSLGFLDANSQRCWKLRIWTSKAVLRCF